MFDILHFAFNGHKDDPTSDCEMILDNRSLTLTHCVTRFLTLWLLNWVDNMQVHGSKPCSMNQGSVTTMELVSPLHLFSIPVRPEHCVLKQRDGKRMANFSTVSKYVITTRAIVVTEANVVQPCIDPVKSPSQIKTTTNRLTDRTGYEAWQTPKQRWRQDLCWTKYSGLRPIFCTIFCLHSFTMHCVTKTFLLVTTSARSKQLLCFLYSQGQKK